MQKIEYRRDLTKNARTGFAKISQADTGRLKTALEDLLTEITEHSVSDDEIWRAAGQKDQKLWGRGQWMGQWQPNTLISVLGGAIKKLRDGDLTDKQVQHVNNIMQVVVAFNLTGLMRVKIPEYQLVEALKEERAVKRLQDKLFYE